MSYIAGKSCIVLCPVAIDGDQQHTLTPTLTPTLTLTLNLGACGGEFSLLVLELLLQISLDALAVTRRRRHLRLPRSVPFWYRLWRMARPSSVRLDY